MRACCQAKRTPVAREKRYIRRDGSPFWARVSATVVRPPGSGDRAIEITSIEDIDTQHKAEIALREAKRELEKVVEERTNALEQRDLLLREVYHRVKNNLQLVDSLIDDAGSQRSTIRRRRRRC